MGSGTKYLSLLRRRAWVYIASGMGLYDLICMTELSLFIKI